MDCAAAAGTALECQILLLCLLVTVLCCVVLVL
jgi:hypothetical protein